MRNAYQNFKKKKNTNNVRIDRFKLLSYFLIACDSSLQL